MKLLQFGLGRWGQHHKRILEDLGNMVETHDIEDKYWNILDCEHVPAIVANPLGSFNPLISPISLLSKVRTSAPRTVCTGDTGTKGIMISDGFF